MTLQNLVGTVYGRMTILEVLPRIKHNRRVIAQCICGTTKEVILGSLRTGRTTSCGCAQKEAVTTHGQSRNGSLLYHIWAAMKSRCNDPGYPKYASYGGRGIKVCPEWEASFEAFLAWSQTAGYQSGLSIDRRDNDKGYFPDNCRWTTKTVQSRNQRARIKGTSKYVGVHLCTTTQKWIAMISVDGKKKNLGAHSTELAAAIARDRYIIDSGLTDFKMNNVI